MNQLRGTPPAGGLSGVVGTSVAVTVPDAPGAKESVTSVSVITSGTPVVIGRATVVGVTWLLAQRGAATSGIAAATRADVTGAESSNIEVNVKPNPTHKTNNIRTNIRIMHPQKQSHSKK
jgi:hypothetical protein